MLALKAPPALLQTALKSFLPYVGRPWSPHCMQPPSYQHLRKLAFEGLRLDFPPNLWLKFQPAQPGRKALWAPSLITSPVPRGHKLTRLLH